MPALNEKLDLEKHNENNNRERENHEKRYIKENLFCWDGNVYYNFKSDQ